MVVALAAAVIVVANPASAQALPSPGAVGGTFTDVCGFVRAVFTNTDPGASHAANIRFSRNGKLLDSAGSQVKGPGSTTLYQVAATGDQFHYEWNVTGGTTESVDYTHVTPGGCDEPRLAVSLVDSCGPEFSVVVSNSGGGPVDVLITAPTLSRARYTVPAGGSVSATVPGVSISGAWVGRYRPDAAGDPAKAVIVDTKQRAAGCGIPWPNDQLVTSTRTCDKVSFVLYALDMTSTVIVRRNGTSVLEQRVDHDIYKFAVAVQPYDVVTVGDSPRLLTYTHVPPAGCQPVGPAVGGPSAGGASGGTLPSALPGASGTPPSTPYPPFASAAGQPPAGFDPAGSGGGTSDPDGTSVALLTVASAIGLMVLGLMGWFLIAALRRRRRVWAVAFGAPSPQLTVRDIGVIPTSSLRWVANPGSTAHYLREDIAP